MPNSHRIAKYILIAALALPSILLLSRLPLNVTDVPPASKANPDVSEAAPDADTRTSVRTNITPAIDEAPSPSEDALPARNPSLRVEKGREVPVSPAAPKERASGCVLVTFRHKAVPGHPDSVHCATHRNLIPMGTPKELAEVNWKSVCLRVDGVPAPFDRAATGVTFGPLAGPGSQVTLRYCRGKTGCPAANDCAPPRDAFLDAIGASLKHEKKTPSAMAKWDPSEPPESNDEPDPTAALEAELRQNDDRDAGSAHGLNLFKDWLVTARSPGCGPTVASTK